MNPSDEPILALYLMRHTSAAPRDPVAFPDDSQRPLTEAGSKKAAGIAQALSRMGVKFDLIFTSPYLRTHQTAEIVRKELGLKKEHLIPTERLSPAGPADLLIADLTEKQTARKVLLVGHEPDLGALISRLLSGGTLLSVTMKKGSLCCLSLDSRYPNAHATLEWLLPPSQLRQP